MVALSVVKKTGFAWSEISDKVRDPIPLPNGIGRCGNYQILYYIVAITLGNEKCPQYYLSTDGSWYAGTTSSTKRHNCLFSDIESAQEAIGIAKQF